MNLKNKVNEYGGKMFWNGFLCGVTTTFLGLTVVDFFSDGNLDNPYTLIGALVPLAYRVLVQKPKYGTDLGLSKLEEELIKLEKKI